MFGGEQRRAVSGRSTTTTPFWDIPPYMIGGSDDFPLVEVAMRWESLLGGLLEGMEIIDGLNFIINEFPNIIRNKGIKQVLLASGGLSMGRREMNSLYYPCLIQVAQCTLEKLTQYENSDSHVVLLILMSAYVSLQKCVRPTQTLLSEQLQLQQLRQRIAEAVTKSIIRMATKSIENTSAFLSDVESQLSCLVSSLQSLSGEGIINFQHIIKEVMASLPYGKIGTYSYVMLLEYCNVLPDPDFVDFKTNSYLISWRNIVTDLVINDPKDLRRAAELLLYHIKPRDGSDRSGGKIEKMSSFDFDRFMHHAAEGIPPEETWSLLGSKQDGEVLAVGRGTEYDEGEDDENNHNITSTGQDTQDRTTRPALGRGLQLMFGRYFSCHTSQSEAPSSTSTYPPQSRSSQPWRISADMVGIWYYGTLNFEITSSGMFSIEVVLVILSSKTLIFIKQVYL